MLEEYGRKKMLYIPGTFLTGDSVDEVSEREREKVRDDRKRARESTRARERKQAGARGSKREETGDRATRNVGAGEWVR